MAPHTQPQIRSIYRRLLRELPIRQPAASLTRSRTTLTKLSSPSVIQKRIRSILSTPHANQQSQIQQAEEFIKYVQAQRMYATLIERYNPGMGMDEEERVRLTARRVGMELPAEFETKK